MNATVRSLPGWARRVAESLVEEFGRTALSFGVIGQDTPALVMGREQVVTWTIAAGAAKYRDAPVVEFTDNYGENVGSVTFADLERAAREDCRDPTFDAHVATVDQANEEAL